MYQLLINRSHNIKNENLDITLLIRRAGLFINKAESVEGAIIQLITFYFRYHLFFLYSELFGKDLSQKQL